MPHAQTGTLTARPWRTTRRLSALVILGLASVIVGCHDIMGSSNATPGFTDPNTFATPDGAMGMFRQAQAKFQSAALGAMLNQGVLTDEMQSPRLTAITLSGAVQSPLDARLMPENAPYDPTNADQGIVQNTYEQLHAVRAAANQAIGALRAYAPASSPALRGELYTMEGFAEIWLADLFCSGIPLSTIDFGKDYTYRAGSSTRDVYAHAAALFDTALTLGTDSIRVVNAAHLGRARALLAMDSLAAAASEAAVVPDGFAYAFLARDSALATTFRNGTIANREGGNGFPFAAGLDPRTPVRAQGTTTLLMPAKYINGGGMVTFVVASAIEARLIQAEAGIHQGDASWLTIVNALRTNGTFTTAPRPGATGAVDTTWNAGLGNVAGLAPLADPGSDTARVSLLFTERAAWLFATAHRQGDLRRLIRQYGRTQETVYPSGLYPDGQHSYGADVTVPIPSAEHANPKFVGCLNRDA